MAFEGINVWGTKLVMFGVRWCYCPDTRYYFPGYEVIRVKVRGYEAITRLLLWR